MTNRTIRSVQRAVACALLLLASAAPAATFVVTSNGDAADAAPGDGACATAAGPCTLRAAIEEHNALGGANRIHFNLSPLSAVRPATNLPMLDSDLVIDGTTQPGFPGTPIVVLDGVNIASGWGLYSSGNTTIRGLVIVYWSEGGVVMQGANISVVGNYIGVSANGSSAQPNTHGIIISHATDGTIGGPGPGDRNVISGNTGAGIEGGSLSDRVTIANNLIGTDPTGTRAIANRYGIYCIQEEGDWAIKDNLVSGNTELGVQFNGWRGGTVTGNFIGTDITGTYAIPNNPGSLVDGYGIYVYDTDGGAGPIVGGTSAGEGNLISGNGGAGLVAGYNTLVMGNYIGTAADGQSPLPNLGHGIKPEAHTTVIGGSTPGAGNVIAYNSGPGIGESAGAQRPIVRGNSIHGNGGLGIDWYWTAGPDGPTAPFPVLTRAHVLGNRVSGTLNAAANMSYIIDFYSNDILEPSGYGEGQTWLGWTTVMSDGSGAASFDLSLGTPLSSGQFITATATSVQEGTTEFSQGVAVTGCLPGSGPCCDATWEFLPAGTECRPAAGACDQAEVCSGTTSDCPPEAYLPAGSLCREAAGPCDLEERCAGDRAQCPADLLAEAGLVCRPVAGACDQAERCAGDSADCPPDGFSEASEACRPAAGVCDEAEHCPGDSAGCPPDGFSPAGQLCRAAAGACDQAESCSGDSADCPPDGFLSAETGCRPGSCADGQETEPAFCTGLAGACPAAISSPCAPYACGLEACLDGCASELDCAPGHACRAGVCGAPGGLGEACLGATSCQSGFCADGRCCDGACARQCEACDLPGAEGLCSPVTGPPHGARTPCASDGSACEGACDGSAPDGCVYPGSSVPCREASCTDAVATLQASCQGTGACPAEQTQACAPEACDGDRCGGGCALDTDCQADQFCAAGVCVDRLALGESCAGASQCLSGRCADGVCCDGDCAGQCEACDLAGSEGTCSPIDGAPHGGRAACAGQGACQGSCDGQARQACAFPGAETECAEAGCEDRQATPAGTCDGAGSCDQPEPLACAPYQCGERACLTGCSDDADCVGGHACVAGECRPLAEADGCGCGASGSGSEAVAWLLLAGLGLRRRRAREARRS